MADTPSNQRIIQLQQFLKEDPNDPFLVYALATEYQIIDALESKKYFEQLLDEHPSYLPTYYHAAHLYATLEEEDLAKETFEKGIALAREQKEAKTLQELNNAYQNYLFEIDD